MFSWGLCLSLSTYIGRWHSIIDQVKYHGMGLRMEVARVIPRISQGSDTGWPYHIAIGRGMNVVFPNGMRERIKIFNGKQDKKPWRSVPVKLQLDST